MPKKKDRSTDEYYRGIIRELTKENKSLRRRLKQLEKTAHNYEEGSDFEEEPEELPTKKDPCPNCEDGTISKILDFEDKIIIACNQCHYKRSIKK